MVQYVFSKGDPLFFPIIIRSVWCALIRNNDVIVLKLNAAYISIGMSKASSTCAVCRRELSSEHNDDE